MTSFEKVKSYLLELGYEVLSEDFQEEIIVTHHPEAGISKLILDCEEPILIIEAPLFRPPHLNEQKLTTLLRMNREIVHGALALSEDGMLIFRDTLQLENLDMNELEGSIESLELMLAENTDFFIQLSKS